jgi:hypothetical protein
MGQPFGVPGIGESCEMKCVLVRGRGDDRVYFAIEGQLGCSLDSVAGDATRLDDPLTVGGFFAASEAPLSD